MKILSVLIIAVLILVMFSSTASAVLVAHWSFDNQADLGHDDSGNGHDGTPYGDTAWVAPGYASFDGDGDYIGLTSSSDLNFDDLSFNDPSGAFSASFWIKPDTVLPSDQTILENEDDYLIYLAGGVLSYLKTDSGNLYHNCWHSTNPEISAGNWTHVVITYDGTGAGGTKMYVNGEEKSVTNTSYHGGGSASGDDFAIGIRAFDFASTPFEGEIDEVKIYNHVVPEPATVLLFGLGSLLLRKRKCA